MNMKESGSGTGRLERVIYNLSEDTEQTQETVESG
jgi:hypothetical protein